MKKILIVILALTMLLGAMSFIFHTDNKEELKDIDKTPEVEYATAELHYDEGYEFSLRHTESDTVYTHEDGVFDTEINRYILPIYIGAYTVESCAYFDEIFVYGEESEVLNFYDYSTFKSGFSFELPEDCVKVSFAVK